MIPQYLYSSISKLTINNKNTITYIRFNNKNYLCNSLNCPKLIDFGTLFTMFANIYHF